MSTTINAPAIAQETAPTAAAMAPPSIHWPQAVELLLAQICVVLDAESRNGFSCEKLERWIDTCSQRMNATGSVQPAVVAELQALTARVLA